jgi:hypothetical protein
MTISRPPGVPQMFPERTGSSTGAMRVIAFIEDQAVIKKILMHLGLWNVKRKPQPLANAPPIDILPLYDDPPGPSADDLIIDPQYPDSLSGVV